VGIPYEDKRFINLASVSKTVDDFIRIISRMDAVITVDTSTYHIADCFNIPTVVLFNTVDPRYRTAYYPHTRGIWLAEGRDSLAQRHKGYTERDRVELDTLYKEFDHERLLQELDLAIESIRTGET
jgi:ADP-heptose:LPS heptosyltransferase